MPALSAEQLVALYELVKKCGLPDSMKEELNALVDSKATGDSSASKPVSPTDCFNLIDFFTASELNQLEACSMWQGASIVASRLKMLGFRAMKESTKKSATAVPVWFETRRAKDMVPPDGDSVYSLSQHAHYAFVTSTTPVPAGVPTLPSFPSNPKHLSKDHFQAAYPDEPPATGKSFPGLAEMRNHHAWLRNSSNSVSQEGKKKVTRVGKAASQVQAQAPTLVLDQQQQQQQQMLCIGNFLNSMHQKFQCNQPALNLSFPQPGRGQVTGLPLQNGLGQFASQNNGAQPGALPFQNGFQSNPTQPGQLALQNGFQNNPTQPGQLALQNGFQNNPAQPGQQPAACTAVGQGAASAGLQLPAADPEPEQAEEQEEAGAGLQAFEERAFEKLQKKQGILKTIHEKGLPEVVHTKAMLEATRKEISSWNAYGSLLQSCKVIDVHGAEKDLMFLNLHSLLHGLFKQGGSFTDLLRSCHSRNPSSAANPY
ncbi:unnamed protein product [Symbiodinium sp. CCMP2592]|nr:unnamed protein product [Symbiodinium sp. CCMP2592]